VNNRQRDVRVGDEVEVTFTGRVFEYDDEVVFALGSDGTLHVTRADVQSHDAIVVVTRGVDHPSHDPAGTVRAGSTEGGHVWVKTSMSYDEGGVWWCLVTGEERTADDVAQWDVVENPNVVALIKQYEENAR
jgi:hypothetical protein